MSCSTNALLLVHGMWFEFNVNGVPWLKSLRGLLVCALLVLSLLIRVVSFCSLNGVYSSISKLFSEFDRPCSLVIYSVSVI